MSNYELVHHGIIGQKWGIRRYQNKDGSLTKAGKKHVAKLQKDYERVTGKKLEVDDSSRQKPKTIKDMSDDDLRNAVNRLRLEKEHITLTRDIDSLSPKKISAGKKFLNSNAYKNAISPALTSVGKQYLEKTLKEYLKLNERDQKAEVERLKTEYLKKNYKKMIADLDRKGG